MQKYKCKALLQLKAQYSIFRQRNIALCVNCCSAPHCTVEVRPTKPAGLLEWLHCNELGIKVELIVCNISMLSSCWRNHFTKTSDGLIRLVSFSFHFISTAMNCHHLNPHLKLIFSPHLFCLCSAAIFHIGGKRTLNLLLTPPLVMLGMCSEHYLCCISVFFVFFMLSVLIINKACIFLPLEMFAKVKTLFEMTLDSCFRWKRACEAGQLDTGWSALRTMCGGSHPTFVTGLAVYSVHIFNCEADCTREELCCLSDIFPLISHFSHLFSTLTS